MKKSCAVLAMMLFAGNTLELPANDLSPRELFLRNLVKKDGVESLRASPWFTSVSVTPTNLVLQFSPSGSGLLAWNSDDVLKDHFSETGEEMILTPGQETFLATRHTEMVFTPVSFRNQVKGFRILHVMDDRLGGYITTCLGYVALSDPPTEVHEDDVEMIMESKRDSIGVYTGEMKWKAYEKSQPVPKAESEVQEPSPNREEPVTATQDKVPVNVAEDGQDEEKSKASSLWLYALIPLCLLAVLWVVKRRRKRDSP